LGEGKDWEEKQEGRGGEREEREEMGKERGWFDLKRLLNSWR